MGDLNGPSASPRPLAAADIGELREVVADQQAKLSGLAKELAASVSDLRVKLAHELSEVLNVVEKQREALESGLEKHVSDMLHRTEKRDAELLRSLDFERQERHDAVAELRAEMNTTLAQVRSDGKTGSDNRVSSNSVAELTRAIKAEREGRENDVARLRTSFNEMMATAASGVRVELSAIQKQLSSLEEREMKLHKEIASTQGAKAGDMQRLVEALDKEQRDRLTMQGSLQTQMEEVAKRSRRVEREVVDKVGRLLDDPKFLGGMSSPAGTRPGSPAPPCSPVISPRITRGATTDLSDSHRSERVGTSVESLRIGSGGTSQGASNSSGKEVQELAVRMEGRSKEMSAVRLRTARISGSPWATARVDVARGIEAETEARLEDAAKLAACIFDLGRSQDTLRHEVSSWTRRMSRT
mmetsp:Transcript_13311/g.30352  ORF Transcript_13311/g.30352 Transcript_13311/m.30352 type:complete len:414 (-) Transcript_13311:81-1322(-)